MDAVRPGYAELHCHTNFSFLDGASHPEELVEEARAARARRRSRSPTTTASTAWSASRVAARDARPPTVFGAELTLGIAPARRTASPIRAGEHLLVLAEGPVGYARARARDQRGADGGGEGRAAHLDRRAGRRGARAGAPAPAAERAQRQLVRAHRLPQGHGAGGAACATARPRRARALDRLVAAFGRDRVLVELWDHGDPLDRHRNDALARIALRAGVEVVATNNVHYATPAQPPARHRARRGARRAVRSTRSTAGSPPRRSRTCAAPAEQARRFARWPGAVERTVEIARACAFDLQARGARAARLPDVPDGHTEMTWLRELTARGAARRATRRPTRSTSRRCARSTTSST